jgi:amino acid adenylation domain-containing protein
MRRVNIPLNEAIAGTKKSKEREYWLKKFPGDVVKSVFPYDHGETGDRAFNREFLNWKLPKDLCTLLLKAARNSDPKLFMILTACVVTLLARYSGNCDICVGSTVLKQNRQVIFINTVLPLKHYVHPDLSFKELLLQVRQTLTEATENQNYPVKSLLYQLGLPFSENCFPLFDTAVLLENIHDRDYLQQITPNILFSFASTNDSIEGTVEYSTPLYEPATIARISDHFTRLLGEALTKPNTAISDLEMISPAEKRQLLIEFKSSGTDTPCEKTIHLWFEKQVAKTPDAVAVTFENRQISFKELNRVSNAIAGTLKQKGVTPTGIVGLMVERSLEMIVGIIGILKAGSAYLPLDWEYPETKNIFMFKDSGMQVLLTQTMLYNDIRPILVNLSPANVVYLDDEALYRYRVENGNGGPGHDPRAPAYVIYTSGTTGTPGGVLIEHRSVVNLANGLNEKIYKHYRPPVIVGLAAPYVFDASVKQIFAALLLGHRLVITSREERMDFTRLLLFYKKYQVEISDGTPAHLRFLIEILKNRGESPGVKHFIIGGEALPRQLVEDVLVTLQPHPPKITNVYGPTECCVDTTSFEINEKNIRQYPDIPIGKPMPNYFVLILNRQDKVQPVGTAGELCVGGIGLARGYLNRPGLTAEKFDHELWDYRDYHDEKKEVEKIRSLEIKKAKKTYKQENNEKFLRGESRCFTGAVFSKSAPPGRRRQRIYKTGDLAKWLSDGNIQFLGRMDHQVKIRGVRVELGEIESQLQKHQDVNAAIVTTRTDDNQDRYLCAYIVSHKTVIAAQLRQYLAKQLPDYLIPLYFTQIEKIPLTPNGKIDGKALPQPDLIINSKREYTAPTNDIQLGLARIWQEVLKVDKIGINDNFFQLGGHSLKSAMMQSQIEKEFNIRIPLVEIFRTPTIKQLGEYIRDAREEDLIMEDDNLVLIKKGLKSKRHIFLIHEGTGDIGRYINFCQQLNQETNCWGIKADRLENYTPGNISISEMAAGYIKKIKKIHPVGPYYIVGYCIGGTIAFEIVRQLEQLNEEIGLFAVIDSPPPGDGQVPEENQLTVETELNWLRSYFPDEELKNQVKGITNLGQLWTLIAQYVDRTDYDVERIKPLVPETVSEALPNFDRLDTKELLYYLNMRRTMVNARAYYSPPHKIKTGIHYFGASQSNPRFKEEWRDFSTAPVISYKVNGGHYSIFNRPELLEFAAKFDRVAQSIFQV